MKVRSQRVSGFTLIEMLVVVAILVALAGLVLPKLDGVVLKSNRGISANNISGCERYIETYRVLHNVYPDRYDSLLDTSGNFAAGTSAATPGILNVELTGFSNPVIHTKLQTTTLVENPATFTNVTSLARAGITTVFDYDPANVPDAPPSGQFGKSRTIDATGKFCTLNVTDLGAAADDDDARGIYNFIYPATRPRDTGAMPIVVGFGRNNTAIGEVLNNCPLYPNSDPTKFYCNFLVVFEARPDNDRAILKCCLGADGDLLQDEMDEYFSQGNASH